MAFLGRLVGRVASLEREAVSAARQMSGMAMQKVCTSLAEEERGRKRDRELKSVPSQAALSSSSPTGLRVVSTYANICKP